MGIAICFSENTIVLDNTQKIGWDSQFRLAVWLIQVTIVVFWYLVEFQDNPETIPGLKHKYRIRHNLLS
ncbi:hypothetical protein A3193_02155 [Candidatus Thiodiazotropha endoloripes]|nr:hypothetical protein A3193_02155 [Candidatus Thiodiazotropha endoloripes]